MLEGINKRKLATTGLEATNKFIRTDPMALYVPKGRRNVQTSNISDSERKETPVTVFRTGATGAKEGTNCSMSGSSSSRGQKPKPRGSLGGVYVPKGRRDLENIVSEDNAPNAPEMSETKSRTTQSTDPPQSLSTDPCKSKELNVQKEKLKPEVTNGSSNAAPDDKQKTNLSKGSLGGGGIYVPKGRRELNEDSEKLAQASAERDEKLRTAFWGDKGTGSGSLNSNENKTVDNHPAALNTSVSAGVSRNSSTSTLHSIGQDKVDPNTKWDSHCMVLKDFSTDMHDFARNNVININFLNGSQGSVLSKWTSSGKYCVLTFKTEIALQTAMASGSGSTGIGRLFSMTSPSDMRVSNQEKEEIMKICQDCYNNFKPLQKDSTVANRLIGAALGIRLSAPSAVPASSSTLTRLAQHKAKAEKNRASSPKRVDAWDD